MEKSFRIYFHPLEFLGGKITDTEDVEIYKLKARLWHFGTRLSLVDKGKILAEARMTQEALGSYYTLKVGERELKLVPMSKIKAAFYRAHHSLKEGETIKAYLKSSSQKNLRLESAEKDILAQAQLMEFGFSKYWHVEYKKLLPEEILSLALLCLVGQMRRDVRH